MKNMNKNRGLFGRMSITGKVVVLYTFLFTFTIISISCVFLYSARSIGAGIVFSGLKENSSHIQAYITEGNELSEENIDDLINDNTVEYIIKNKNTGERYVSLGLRMPDDSMAYIPENLPSEDGNIPQPSDNENNQDNVHANSESKSENIQTENIPSDSESKDNRNSSSVDEGGEKVKLPFMLDNEYSVYSKDGKDYITVDNEVMYEGDMYSIRLFKSSADIMRFVKYIETRLYHIDLAGIVLAFFISAYISKVLLRPVTKIRETAEKISVEDLSQRIEIEGPDDELKELSITFNSMIDRLESSFEQQSRFVSDASHELRTPISVIKGYANLINRWGKDDPEILQEAVNSILEETEHMSVMIKNLLFLARSDQHRNHVQIQPMSLGDAVNDIAKDLSVMDEKVEVETDISEDIIINGDPDLIKQMLWIYTENALKYSGENKKVQYKLYKENGYACICVKDNGFGIKDEDIPHIFERFYRVDKSRNKEIPGNGLGLSIAKWIMDIHHGKIEVKSVVGQGTEFINKFPMD